jgi:hypothetical protein
MPSIGQLMIDTALQYGARNPVNFYQLEYFIKGVCHAMCLRWIKSNHKIGFFNSRRAGIKGDVGGAHLRSQISTIQSNLRNYRGDIINAKNQGGFGALEAIRIYELSIEAPNFHTDEPGAKVPEYITMLKMAAEFCSAGSDGSCSVISLEDGGTGHAVATAHCKGMFYFMDPNGGVLIFPIGDHFSRWFVTEFPKASNYGKLHWIKVENYQVGA